MRTRIISTQRADSYVKEFCKEFVPYYHGDSPTILKKETIAITIDAFILARIKASGTGYQARINQCLREAVLSGNF